MDSNQSCYQVVQLSKEQLEWQQKQQKVMEDLQSTQAEVLTALLAAKADIIQAVTTEMEAARKEAVQSVQEEVHQALNAAREESERHIEHIKEQVKRREQEHDQEWIQIVCDNRSCLAGLQLQLTAMASENSNQRDSMQAALKLVQDSATRLEANIHQGRTGHDEGYSHLQELFSATLTNGLANIHESLDSLGMPSLCANLQRLEQLVCDNKAVVDGLSVVIGTVSRRLEGGHQMQYTTEADRTDQLMGPPSESIDVQKYPLKNDLGQPNSERFLNSGRLSQSHPAGNREFNGEPSNFSQGVPAPKLPTFSGDGWRGFILQLEEMGTMYNWDATEKRLRLFLSLRGDAVRFYTAISKKTQVYKEIKDRFEARFDQKDPPATVRTQLQTIKQFIDENNEAFAARVWDLVTDGYPDSADGVMEEYAVDHYLNGLLDKQVAWNVKNLQIKKLSEAVTRVRTLTVNKKSIFRDKNLAGVRRLSADTDQNWRSNGNSSSKQSSSWKKPSREELSDRFFKFKPQSNRCWICGNERHMWRECEELHKDDRRLLTLAFGNLTPRHSWRDNRFYHDNRSSNRDRSPNRGRDYRRDSDTSRESTLSRDRYDRSTPTREGSRNFGFRPSSSCKAENSHSSSVSEDRHRSSAGMLRCH